MKSVAVRMSKAKVSIMGAVNKTMQEHELPAYIMETIVSEVLCDLRQTANYEMLSEIEREDKGEK